MKLKSLLLGSAAALALSTGAQAADPIASFVSLDVCDAYGISGLTISSDDTCLRISGEVEYEFAYGAFTFGDDTVYAVVDGDTGAGYPAGVTGPDIVAAPISSVDWNLQFEATTQSDFGMARAVIRLVEGDDQGVGGVNYDRAFVSFGDTTVITAGLAGSIFGRRGDNHILSEVSHARNSGESHVIQIAHDLGNGWDIAGGFENLDGAGLAGARVSFSDGAFGGRLGAVVKNMFDLIEVDGTDADWRVYGDLSADLGNFEVFAEFNGGQTAAGLGVLDAIVTGAADLDFVSVRAGVGLAYREGINDDNAWFRAGAGVAFALTDTVDLDIEVVYNDKATKFEDYYLIQLPWGADAAGQPITGVASIEAALSETLSVEAWAGVGATTSNDVNATQYGAGLGLGYNPGGDFELGTGVGFAAIDADGTDDTASHWAVHFNASKSF